MEEKDYLKLAKEYSLKRWNFDIVLSAGEEDGWHYFSCTRANRPKWSSVPRAIRINSSLQIENVDEVRIKVNSRAYKLNLIRNS